MAAKKVAVPAVKEPGFLDEIADAFESVADVVNGDIFDGLNPTQESPADEHEAPAAPAQPRSPGGTFQPAPKEVPKPDPAPGSGGEPKP